MKINLLFKVKHKIHLTVFLLFMMFGVAHAQTKTITGTVSSDDGEPLFGATVLIKGTTKGAQTDFD